MNAVTFHAFLSAADLPGYQQAAAAVSGSYVDIFSQIVTAPDSDPAADYDSDGNFVGPILGYIADIYVSPSDSQRLSDLVSQFASHVIDVREWQHQGVVKNPHATGDGFAANGLRRRAGRKFGAVGNSRTDAIDVTEPGGQSFAWDDLLPTGMGETDNRFEIVVSGTYTIKCEWFVEYLDGPGGPPVALLKNNSTLEILQGQSGTWAHDYALQSGDLITLGLRASPPGRDIHYTGLLAVDWLGT